MDKTQPTVIRNVESMPWVLIQEMAAGLFDAIRDEMPKVANLPWFEPLRLRLLAAVETMRGIEEDGVVRYPYQPQPLEFVQEISDGGRSACWKLQLAEGEESAPYSILGWVYYSRGDRKWWRYCISDGEYNISPNRKTLRQAKLDFEILYLAWRKVQRVKKLDSEN